MIASLQSSAGAAFFGIGIGMVTQGRSWGWLLAGAGLVAWLPAYLSSGWLTMVCRYVTAAVAERRMTPLRLAGVCAAVAFMGLSVATVCGGWARDTGICVNVSGIALAIWAARSAGDPC